jgi:PhnB protein
MITPYLLYEDVAGAMRFLSKAFGLKKSGSAMSGKNGELTHAAMKLADDLIMMGYPGPRYKNPKKLGEATQMLYVKVNDADKHFMRAKKSGAKILEEPEDTFYGHRRYRRRILRGINGISSTKSERANPTNVANSMPCGKAAVWN